MKLRLPSVAIAAVLVVSAISRATGASTAHDATRISTSSRSSKLSDGGSNAVPFTVDVDNCLGLPRNTVLASCPAPCLADAPCIVYDQDAEHTKLTGCDYGLATANSFCATKPTRTCEFHCFPMATSKASFSFQILFQAPSLGKTKPRTPPTPSLIQTPSAAFQTNDFVVAVGKLNLTKSITDVRITGQATVKDINRLVGVDVNPAIIASVPSITWLFLRDLPLGTDRAKAILASAPPTLTDLTLAHTGLQTLSWSMFAPVPNLKTLALSDNRIPLISKSDLSFGALVNLKIDGNNLTSFDLRAPLLATLNLHNNQLVRIPESVYSYTKLKSLSLTRNPLIRPLVLTARQVEFLEALPGLLIQAVDPPASNPEIVSRLPAGGGGIYGNYSDDVDISLLLVGATKTTLLGDPTLPVCVVDDDKAAMYNRVLENRARNWGANSTKPSNDDDVVPEDRCQGVKRKTLLSNCISDCPSDGACITYDQNSLLTLPSGCDYSVASTSSFCTKQKPNRWFVSTCEFQCFPAYEPQSQFKFFIPFKSSIGDKIKRLSADGDFSALTTKEIPFLSNSFVEEIGVLNLTSVVTEVSIVGGQSETETQEIVADVKVSAELLSKAESVVALSLINIDLGKANLTGILGRPPPVLRSLNLRNTNLAAVPEAVFMDLQQLETLTLAQNSLASLDIQKTILPKLTTLDLSQNLLRTLDIQAPNLKALDLSGNFLVRIPVGVFALTNLKTINLKNNLFTFPLVLSPTQLEFLKSGIVLHVDLSADPGPTQPPPNNTEPSIRFDNGTVAGGSAEVVAGVPVIIVDEQTANQYNDQLEQKQQQESAPRPRSRSTSDGGGGNDSTSATSSDSPSSTGNPSNASASSTPVSDTRRSTTGSASSAIDSDLRRSDDVGTTPGKKEDAATESGANDVSLTIKLMLGGVGAAFFGVILVLVIAFKRRRADADKESSYIAMTENEGASSSDDSPTVASQLLPWWKDDDMLSHRLNAGDIGDVRVIGSGSSGLVWLVNYRGGSRQLVSKRLIQREGAAHEVRVMQLFAEAKIASALVFSSIVPFVGVAWTDKTDLQVLYEYMPNGDLSSYLARTNASTLPWSPKKLQFAIDIVEALVYSHSFNPPLLHRDVKASNVLLDDEFKANLGGFGSARPESDNDTMTTHGVGSDRWLAPEILMGSTSYDSSSDIYSFGVVLCELDTHTLPYAALRLSMDESTLLQRVARGELRPPVSNSCPPAIREIADACLAFDAANRPSAMQIAYRLRSLRQL